MITTHDIVFTCYASEPLYADRDKTGQVLNNLISNAVKYSKPGTFVNISCKVDHGFMEVAVRDEGFGIQPGELEHVFERYYRAEIHINVSGFGIGLYLCAEIIKRHHGKIWAESELGKGSIFYFSLPLSDNLSD